MIVAFPGYLHLYFCKYSLFFVNILNQSIPTITDLVFSKDLCFDIFTSRPQWLRWMRRPTGDQEIVGSTPRRSRQHSFVETDHEIFSTVSLSLPLIQEGQLSVSDERMCTILVNRLED